MLIEIKKITPTLARNSGSVFRHLLPFSLLTLKMSESLTLSKYINESMVDRSWEVMGEKQISRTIERPESEDDLAIKFNLKEKIVLISFGVLIILIILISIISGLLIVLNDENYDGPLKYIIDIYILNILPK